MKYPRTLHIHGSLGKIEPKQVSLSELPGEVLVVEEKLDGTQVSLRFESQGQIVFQSRGHVLLGGSQEAEFALLKSWAYTHITSLWKCLGLRYVMYGEWLYAKHTVFYDALPDYFLEFDIWDNERGCWLSTTRRRELLTDTPVVSVPVLYEGPIVQVGNLEELLQPSLYKTSNWQAQLQQLCESMGLDVAQILKETELSNYPEGLYVKSETSDTTEGRYKYIRPDFLQSILDSGSHWKHRQIIPNRVAHHVRGS